LAQFVTTPPALALWGNQRIKASRSMGSPMASPKRTRRFAKAVARIFTSRFPGLHHLDNIKAQ
jgi:hypothetical protein